MPLKQGVCSRYNTTEAVAAKALRKPLCVGRRRGTCEDRGQLLLEAHSGADLGGSSDYSSERLEDLSGEGFRVQVTLPRLSRWLRTQARPLVEKLWEL